jgi:hypothetical protein
MTDRTESIAAQRAGSTTVEFAAASHVGGLTHYKARFVKRSSKRPRQPQTDSRLNR